MVELIAPDFKQQAETTVAGAQKSSTQWNITSHTLERLLPEKQEITNVGEDVGKREISYTVGG